MHMIGRDNGNCINPIGAGGFLHGHLSIALVRSLWVQAQFLSRILCTRGVG